MKKSFGVLLSSYAKTINRSQTSLAEEAGITHASLNRFFNDKSNLSSDALVDVLKAMDIDLVQIILDKQAKKSQDEDINQYETTEDAIRFLINNLEPRGQQTQLKNLEWINELAGKEKIPKAVRSILKREVRLV